MFYQFMFHSPVKNISSSPKITRFLPFCVFLKVHGSPLLHPTFLGMISKHNPCIPFYFLRIRCKWTTSKCHIPHTSSCPLRYSCDLNVNCLSLKPIPNAASETLWLNTTIQSKSVVPKQKIRPMSRGGY